jgi:Ca2+-binding RTX toxin-like protein
MVLASTNYTLEAGSEVERLRADAGSTGITLTGNEFGNKIMGGAGDDHITGGDGKDILTGGAGSDTFVFNALTDSVVGSARDKIVDFVDGTDRIDLSAIDAISGTPGDDGFHFVGDSALRDAGDLRVTVTGGNTLVSADVNGDHKADFQILLMGVHALTASDFML